MQGVKFIMSRTPESIRIKDFIFIIRPKKYNLLIDGQLY